MEVNKVAKVDASMELQVDTRRALTAAITAFSKNMFSYFDELQQSLVYTGFFGIISALLYTQDILQDILVASSSISSEETYRILSHIEVQEKKLGFAMIGIFCISLIAVGVETIVKINQLMLVKNCRKIYFLIFPACLLNLGPVALTLLQFISRMKVVKKLYKNEDEWKHDQKVINDALSTTKTREALLENLPMLVIVCFKIALSSRVSLLEVFSSTSSACLFSKVVVHHVKIRIGTQLNVWKTVILTITATAYIYCSLILITTFAIESERDGIMIPNDPTSGVEESSGMVFLLLIFPTIFFCLLPFSIYDLAPAILGDSLSIKEYFTNHPKPIWYASIALQTLGLIYHLGTAHYFIQRDSISITSMRPIHYVNKGCETTLFGGHLPFCSQWDLKVGGGRIIFKGFMIVSMITSSLVFVFSTNHVLGMQFRDRICFRNAYRQSLNQKLKELLDGIYKKSSQITVGFPEDFTAFTQRQISIFADHENPRIGRSVQ